MKLHLANQADQTHMPPFIIGALQQDQPQYFVLSHVLEPVETPDTYDIELRPRAEIDFISKTYVWRVEFLEEKPLDNAEFAKQYISEGGGLG